MSELWERVSAWLAARPLRERWLMIAGACALVLVLFQSLAIAPLRQSLAGAEQEGARLETDLLRAQHLAYEAIRLRDDLALVEARVKPGEKTNLFTLLESLADQAQIKDQLDSIKPKQASGNDRYPETRVEVSVKGATLKQTVQFLYEIEQAPVLLIIRSLRIKSRRDDSKLLDVSFSVSSFERA